MATKRIPDGLDDIFRTQDAHAAANCAAMSKEFSLLEEALLLTSITISVLNSSSVIEKRRTKSGLIPDVERIQINLAYITWSTVVSMCRLLTFGAFVNMLSLYRDALESLSFYWYLRREPSDVCEWENALLAREVQPDKSGDKSFARRRKAFDNFRRKVKKRFEQENKPVGDYNSWYYVLSTLGTHTNPYSIASSLPSEGRKQNFGFMSVGEDENLRCLAHDILHLLMFLLEEIYGQFGRYIPPTHTYQHKITGRSQRGHHVVSYEPIVLSVPSRYAQLKKDFRSFDSNFTGKLKLW